MAQTYNSTTNEQITFEEFIEFVKKTITQEDEDSLLTCVDSLFKLCNNRSFLIEYFNKFFRSSFNPHEGNTFYSEQSFVLYSCKEFFVRATYWPTASKSEKTIIRESHDDLFAYGLVHDHNFQLLTAGYTGDGYRTKLWEYDYENVVGYSGEKVEIKFLEETTLSTNKALYYRPSRDIHCQLPPVLEDSIAINIITSSVHQSNRQQFEFNIKNQSIKKLFKGKHTYRHNLIDVASIINNSETVDLLAELATKSISPMFRRQSIESLYKIEKSKDILRIGMKDNDKKVSEYFSLKYNLHG
jgi:hypothetical protein